MYTLQFTFLEKGKNTIILNNIAPKQTILDIAHDHHIELHHNCGGVCACSTCHIYIDKGEEYFEEVSDKEENFIDRSRSPQLNSRLACQCFLKEASGEIHITIPDQSVITGE
ncbi:MAG: 2Fe-2S iron-sulfur cluster-binding protein [Chitinophagaceae bacterium]